MVRLGLPSPFPVCESSSDAKCVLMSSRLAEGCGFKPQFLISNVEHQWRCACQRLESRLFPLHHTLHGTDTDNGELVESPGSLRAHAFASVSAMLQITL